MVNKIVFGVGAAAVIGLMVAGVAYAVSGTEVADRTGDEAGGRWASDEAGSTGGRWSTDGAAVEPLASSEDRHEVTGVVQSIDGSLLVLEAGDGELVEVSLGRSDYWEAQGVQLAPGQTVVVEGFYEDSDLFTASSVTLVSSGQTVVLRDQSGRPMWAGGRRGAGAAWAQGES